MRSYKIGVVGNNWLVKTAFRTFLIFCMKLWDYRGSGGRAGGGAGAGEVG